MKKEKRNIIIVGPINKKNYNVFGGTLTSLKLLKKSELSKRYNLIFLDTCPRSISSNNIFMKLPISFFRTFRFLILCLRFNPKIILLFIAGPRSFFEKGIMNLIAKFLNIGTIIFPRANALINWYEKNIFNKIIFKLLIFKVNKIICQGVEMKNFFLNKLNADFKKIFILNNWTLTSEISKIGLKKLNLYKVHNQKFLFMGWLIKEKGIYDLLNAFTYLKDEFPSVRLFIAGHGKEYNALKIFIKENNLKDYCKLLGWVKGKKKLDLLENCDSLVLPSYSEGFPNSIIEALGSCLSVVSTSVGSISSQLEPNSEFLLIPQNNTKFLYKKLKQLILDKSLHNRISKNGYKKSLKNYSLKNVSLELISIIEKDF